MIRTIKINVSCGLLSAAALLLSNLALAVNCDDIFTNGVQNNSSSGSISLDKDVVISGGGTVLNTLNLSGGNGACSGSNCSASGLQGSASAVTFQYGNGADGSVNVAKESSQTIGNSGDYQFTSLTMGKESQLTFSSSQSSYFFQQDWSIDGTLTLAPGDYWVDGSITIAKESNIAVSGTGTVRLFVSGTLNIGNGATLNTSGGAGQLLVYAVGNINISKEVDANGYFYSQSDISIGKDGDLTGGVSAAGSVDVSKEENINYVAPNSTGGDFGGFCDSSGSSPVLVAEWRLDDVNWVGAANEVADSSGNGLHGKAVSVSGLPTLKTSTPALAGNPGTCAYGSFTGPDSGYLKIDDPGNNSLLDLDTALTVTSWIYPHSYATDGLMTIVSKDENFEYHINASGYINWWWGGGSKEMNSTATVPLNSWSHIAIVYRDGSQKIYINGVLAGTHNDSGPLTTQNDPVFIGRDLSFNSRTFNGYIDEVRIYNGAMTEAEVQTVYAETHTCNARGPDHYHIAHAGSGITCEQSTVTITPHDTDHGAVSADGTTITLSTTPANDGWTAVSGNGTLSGNQYTFAGGETSVQLGLTKLVPATLNIDITDGLATDVDGDTGPGGEDPLLVFSDVGFKFYGDGIADSIGTQISGKNSNVAPNEQVLSLRAVQTNQNTGRCDALISGGSVNIGLAYECNDPTTCALANGASIEGATISGFSDGGSASYQPVSLNFDVNGEAAFVFNYADAGQLTLHASANLPVGHTTKTVTGSSNAFVVKPAGFCIESEDPSASCASSGVACVPFKKTGEPFNLVVTAKGWGGVGDTDYCDNATTQNFAGSVTLGNSLDSILTGSAASLSASTAAILSGNSGSVTLAQTVDNVGNFTFTGSVSDYLGAGSINNSSSDLIGRFVPYQFKVFPISITTENAGYTYAGQPFTVKFDIEAQNADGMVVSNYSTTTNIATNLALLTEDELSFGVRNNASAPLSSLNSRLVDDDSAVTWISGSATDTRQLVIARNGLEAPFERLQVGVVANESNDTLDIDTVLLDLDTTLDSVNDKVFLGELSQRVGRLFTEDVWGPEKTALDVPLRTEYWNGNDWVTAIGDGTAIDRSAITFTSSAGASGPITSDPITAPIGVNPSVTYAYDPTGASVITLGDATASATGDALMQVGAPGIQGFFTMDVDLTSFPWLRYDWDQDGNYENDVQLPPATVRFETYRGHDRVIYWQEVGL